MQENEVRLLDEIALFLNTTCIFLHLNTFDFKVFIFTYLNFKVIVFEIIFVDFDIFL